VSLAFGVSILAVAAAPTLPICLAMLVLMGAASIMFIATANSLLQLNSSSAMRGRVMALWAVVFLGSTPIGAPLIGFIAGRYGARFALCVGGVAAVLIAVWAGFELRRIRNVRRAAGTSEAPADKSAPVGKSVPAGTSGAPAGAIAAGYPAADAKTLQGGFSPGR
jgi:MFS family permease